MPEIPASSRQLPARQDVRASQACRHTLPQAVACPGAHGTIAQTPSSPQSASATHVRVHIPRPTHAPLAHVESAPQSE